MAFSGPEVRAILSGAKTQVRLVVDPQPRVGRYGATHPTKPSGVIGPCPGSLGGGNYHVWDGKKDWPTACLTEDGVYVMLRQCPYGEIGDRLWVKEATYIAQPNFSEPSDGNLVDPIGRRRIVCWSATANGSSLRCAEDYGIRETARRRMPRWASRLTLEITDVRVQRIHEISEADALAEGCDGDCPVGYIPAYLAGKHSYHFAQVWDEAHSRKPTHQWAADPWVWILTFRVLDPKEMEGGVTL